MAVTVDHSKANSVEISTSENTVNIIGPDDNTITITEDKVNTINVLEVGAQGPAGTFEDGNSHLFNHITASGDISASGDLEVRNVTASGVFSSSYLSSTHHVFGSPVSMHSSLNMKGDQTLRLTGGNLDA